MLKKYNGKPFTLTPNKMQIEPITMEFSELDEFNAIYAYCKKNFMQVYPTKSKGIPYGVKERMYSRFMVVTSMNKIELTIVSYEGCFRFVIGNKRNLEKNPVSGKEAVRTIYKKANELNINLSKYKVNKEKGEEIKRTIKSPHIEMFGSPKTIYQHVHHLDLNSSYASRIIETYPELKPLYELMYSQRHKRDSYFKHVLTNHIGCWQSEYCPDVMDKGKIAPYQFANLSKIAVDGTRDLIEYYVDVLKKSGRQVLLTNTDGIWYRGELFHDDREGTELGQWKNDHIDCTFVMKSKGAYQFIEQNKCHTVVRGTTLLDREKEREDWEFGDIFKNVIMEWYEFDNELGVVKHEQEI